MKTFIFKNQYTDKIVCIYEQNKEKAKDRLK